LRPLALGELWLAQLIDDAHDMLLAQLIDDAHDMLLAQLVDAQDMLLAQLIDDAHDAEFHVGSLVATVAHASGLNCLRPVVGSTLTNWFSPRFGLALPSAVVAASAA
jgi:hypothetical protein